MKTSQFPGTINPLVDPRWKHFVESHPLASIFHHPSWLKALHRTYGFTPLAFTSAKPEETIHDGLLFCPLQSWLTGKRLVSLPFSDHCDVLADSDDICNQLIAHMAIALGREFDYAEIRSTTTLDKALNNDWHSSHRFVWHTLSLQPAIDEIFRGFHKNSIQRKIKRAERERLQHLAGNSDILIDHFYTLLMRTRRRHRIPPQPFCWFRILRDCMGNRMRIHVALYDGRPTAAILTLSHQTTLTYKYSCSDERFNSLGGVPFLFWHVIQNAKLAGFDRLDLGRTEAANEGLTTFKRHLGATASPLPYWTCNSHSSNASRPHNFVNLTQRMMPPFPEAFLRLPRAILSLPGALLYPHMD